MSRRFWLTGRQMEWPRPFPLKSRGKPRADDQRVLGGIIYVKKNGLQWKDAPSVHGPPETFYNRFVRWPRMGVFARILIEPPQPGSDGEIIMIGGGASDGGELLNRGPRPRATGRTKGGLD